MPRPVLLIIVPLLVLGCRPEPPDKITASASVPIEETAPRAHSQAAPEALQEVKKVRKTCFEHTKRGDLEAAVTCYERVTAQLQTLDAPGEQAGVLNRLGLVRRQQGDTRRAAAAFKDALELARKASDPIREANSFNNLALLAKRRGEHHQAIEFYRQALDLWRSTDRRTSESTTLHNLGVTYSELGHYEKAQDLLEQAVAIRISASGQARASTWTAIGWNRHLAGKPREARQALEQAEHLSREANDPLAQAVALDRLGTVLRDEGDLGAAARAYRQALQLAGDFGGPHNVASARANLGALLISQGHLDQAKDELESARTFFEEVKDRDGLADTLVELARLERLRGNLKVARAQLERALVTIEEIRFAARSRGRRVRPVPLWEDYHDFYVDLLMELHHSGGALDAEVLAFQASDLTRARNFYEMLAESRIDLRADIDNDLLQREKEIQERLDTTAERRQHLSDQATTKHGATFDRALRELRIEYQDIQAEIRVQSPGFAEVRDPRAVELAEIQTLLGPKTRLLSYVLGKERSFLFDIGSTDIKSYELGPREKLESLATAAYHALRSSAERRGRGQVTPTVRGLGKALFPPTWRPPEADRLFIVGEGALLYIPFIILPLPGSTESLQLIDRYQITHLPSAASLVALRQRDRKRPRAPLQIAVLADPVFHLDDARFQSSSDAAQEPDEPRFDRLIHSRREAQSILARVPPHQSYSALGFDANSDLATDSKLQQYQILHFATHAVIDEAHPELSGLVLSRYQADGSTQKNAHLRLHQIYGLQLPADLIVLSACRTALGELRRGEGLVGLTRGFFYAGASSLIVSLWDVEDEATANLMDRLYCGIFDERLSPAAALRQAQLQLREEPRWQAPFYWAGFVLQGG